MNDALPDFIVIRPAPGTVLPGDFDGRWYDRRDWPTLSDEEAEARADRARERGYVVSEAVHAVATGRFEVRGDGAVAEVFEVRP